MFQKKKILITGGTGSLGQALTKSLLKENVDTIRIFSRDELKQVQMNSQLKDDRLRFFIGDIRDKERLSRALEDVDIVIHAAALKQVPVAEYNPFEAVKTNVYGAQNLIEACLDKKIKLAIAVGTDKAVSPLNTYGATKLLMERLFVTANYWKGKNKINFLCVRYGNVLGSRGSAVPVFIDQIKQGKKITITDPSMTRFNITMNQAIDLIFRAIKYGNGGEVFVPKLRAYRVGDMKDAIVDLMKSKSKVQIIGVRQGEKFHESLINKEEVRNTFESKDDYILIERSTQNSQLLKKRGIKKSTLSEEYCSANVKFLTKEELKKILIQEKIILN